MIEKKKIEMVTKIVAKKFPDFKGITPTITSKRILPQVKLYRKLSMGTPKALKYVTSMTFKKTIRTVDAVKMERILIVTLDERGKIIKIIQSR